MAVMVPLYEVPFAPAYDDIWPSKKEDEKGVLCVYFNPMFGSRTVRMQRNLNDIMNVIGLTTRYVDEINFYKLGNKMLITHGAQTESYKDALIYNGEKFDLESPVLICNKDFTSLTESEALVMLESTRLRRNIKSKTYNMSIEINEVV